MRLSAKMVLVFSAMMLAALMIFSSFAARSAVDSANAFTEARFRNMAVSISRDLNDEFRLMKLTLDELTGNTTFMAALNQMIRDDSEDQKMGLAAGKTAVQQMAESPLVDSFRRVTFYSREGIFLTAPALMTGEGFVPEGSNNAKAEISAFPWLDDADATDSALVLPPHEDFLSNGAGAWVYGLVRRVYYRDKPIGYLEINRDASELESILDFTDGEEELLIQVHLVDGPVLYSNSRDRVTWPDSLPLDEYSRVTPEGSDREYNAYHVALEEYGIHLVIARDAAVTDANNQGLRWAAFRRALMVAVPTILVIAFLSFRLTRSTRRLTRKMREVSTANILSSDETTLMAMMSDVTSRADAETHELEQVFNNLMLRLRENASTELALREGSLQAQLSALQTQINPHFIYNTLNIISAKAMESGSYDIIEICDQFAQMLRYSTDTRSRTATMAEEIDNVRNYLMLAKARYEDNLEFTIDVPEDLSGITVPKLTLQPLVENALNHGFDGNNVKRLLNISGKIEDNVLKMEIRDNGNGFSEEMLRSLRERIREIEEGKVSIDESGGHIGLVNTCLRLHYYSQGEMHVAIRNDGGAVITITMPCGQKKNPA